ncbi:MAG: hypothetical protein ACREL3_05050 [Gemmatimonadales bacterium]
MDFVKGRRVWRGLSRGGWVRAGPGTIGCLVVSCGGVPTPSAG